MYIHPGGALFGIGYTHGSTGALTNADSLPTGNLYRNGAVDGTVTVTVALVASTTGKYNVSCTLPSGYVEGDLVALEIDATVGGVSDASIVQVANVTTAIPNAVAGAANGLPLGDGSAVLECSILNRLQALVPIQLTVLSSPAPTTSTFSATVSAGVNYLGWEVVFSSGVNANSDALLVSGFSLVSTTGAFTLENPLGTAPSAGDTFYIVGGDLPKEFFLFLTTALGSDNKVLLSNNAQTGVTIPTVTTVGTATNVTNAVPLPANVPTGFLSTDTTVLAIKAKTDALVTVPLGTVVGNPAPTATTFTATGLGTLNNEYFNSYVLFISGNNAGATAQPIIASTSGGQITCSALPQAPVAGDRFIIVGSKN